MDLEAIELRMMILLLGASDMYQVEEAGAAILDELDKGEATNLMLARALETALYVCYWRPFSQSNTLGHLVRGDALDAEVHEFVRDARNHAHAHIAVEAARWATLSADRDAPGEFSFGEAFYGLGVEWVVRIVDVAERQRRAWQTEAREIRDRLARANWVPDPRRFFPTNQEGPFGSAER